MLLTVYGLAVILGALAGALSAGAFMLLSALLGKIARLTIPFSFLAAQFLLWHAWHRVTAPVRRGFANGEIDGPTGIGGAALLVGMNAFLVTGSICLLGLSIRLWIEARRRSALELETIR